MRRERNRALLAAVAVALALQFQQGAAPMRAQSSPPEALTFFKNYFVTGDYVEAGVGLRGRGVNGIATGAIQMPDTVPANADILAAFLYWQVVSSAGPDEGATGATFRGYPLQSPEGPLAKVLGAAGSSPCWNPGGSTGDADGSKRTYTYRADVKRFFDIDELTGKQIVGGPHPVQLPDSGSGGNALPLALGASLVVIYRDTTQPLNAIVIYDGGFTVNNANRTMTQARMIYYGGRRTEADIWMIERLKAEG